MEEFIGVRKDDRVYFGEHYGTYHPLEWHAGANNGNDIYGCRIRTVAMNDGRLLVQHGEDFRTFTLDELNYVGVTWQAGSVLAWCDSFHT